MKLPVYLPENLELDKLFDDKPPHFKFNVDKFKYILNLMGELEAFNRTYDRKTCGFIRLNSDELKCTINDYRNYLNYLIDCNVIITDNSYVPRKKSIGYRIAPEFCTVLKEDFIETWTLIRNIRKREKDQKTQCRHLDKWFKNLEIDFESAKKFAERRKQKDDCEKDKKSARRYNSAFRNLRRIESKQFFIKRDKKVKRYHSNLTCLASELRNYLTFENEKLFSCDLKSSQPYLSCMLLNRNFFFSSDNESDKFSILTLPRKYQKKLNHFIQHISKQPPYTTTHVMSGESFESIMDNDVELYQNLILEGKLYDYVSELASERIKPFSRKEIKKAFFYILFEEDSKRWDSELTSLIIELFPNVFKLFSKIKEKDHALLAIILQYLESKVFIDNICGRIAKERPELPIFTIHDSLSSTVGNEQYIKRVIAEELYRATGMMPQLSIEYWCPENVPCEIHSSGETRMLNAEIRRSA